MEDGHWYRHRTLEHRVMHGHLIQYGVEALRHWDNTKHQGLKPTLGVGGSVDQSIDWDS